MSRAALPLGRSTSAPAPLSSKKRSKKPWGASSAKLCHGSRVELQVVLVSRAWDDTAKGEAALVVSLTQALACFAAIPERRGTPHKANATESLRPESCFPKGKSQTTASTEEPESLQAEKHCRPLQPCSIVRLLEAVLKCLG